mgnify:CR=1 FL=1
MKNVSRPKEYKYNFSNKSIQSAKKFKNITQMKKPEIKKIKDINLFDNDYSYMKGKEDLYKKYNNTQIYNNNSLKERNNSLSQRNRRLLNMSNNNTLNTSTMRVKNVIITKSINNIIFKPYQNLSSNRSHSKIIKKRKIYDNSFINNTYMKTVENRKNINSSLDKNRNSNTKQIRTQYVKKNKKKDNVREIYYQKPIINKITHMLPKLTAGFLDKASLFDLLEGLASLLEEEIKRSLIIKNMEFFRNGYKKKNYFLRRADLRAVGAKYERSK